MQFRNTVFLWYFCEFILQHCTVCIKHENALDQSPFPVLYCILSQRGVSPSPVCSLLTQLPPPPVCQQSGVINAHYTQYTAHYTLHTAHYILQTKHCTLHVTHDKIHKAQDTIHPKHFSRSNGYLHFNMTLSTIR